MKTKAPTKTRTVLFALSALALLIPGSASAQGTAITYQGRLNNAGSPASGNHNFVFTLKNALTGGATVGTAVTRNAVPVTGGTFSTSLDFGASAFSGGSRWLEISVNGTTLSPRQPIAPAPVALGLPNVYTLDGKVGIGTTTPAAPLHAVGNPFLFEVSHPSLGGLVQIATPGGDPGFIITTNSTDSLKDRFDIANLGSRFHMGFNGTAPFTISKAGNVGIGTSTPGATLDLHTGDASGRANLLVRRLGLDYIGLEAPSGNPYTSKIVIRGVGSTTQTTAIAIGNNTDNLGNVGIGTESPTQKLTVAGNIQVTTCIITSDRDKKDGFASVDPREVLEKVAAMPITKWHYKTETGVDHIGPMAQDFHAAFGIGTDDKHISTVDADGIALAAIKGLKQELDEKNAVIEALEGRLRIIEQQLSN